MTQFLLGRRMVRSWWVVAIALTMFAGALSAQGSQESFAAIQQPSGFTPLTGATVLYSSDPLLGGSQNENIPHEVTLPFPFVFYGETRTSIWVIHCGVLLFSETPPVPSGNNQSPTSTTTPNRVSVFWDAFTLYPVGSPTFPITLLPNGPRTIVSHKTEGVAPNRTWTVEYLNMARQLSGSTAIEVSCQAVFHEVGGRIVFKYPTMPFQTYPGLSGSVGLTGAVVGGFNQGGVDAAGSGGSNNFVPDFNYVFEPIRGFGYFTSFESGAGSEMGWSVTTTSGTSWEWANLNGSTIGPSAGANGSASGWRTSNGVAGNGPNTITVLESPRMRHSGSVVARVNFFMNMSSQAGVSGGRLEIKRNEGAYVAVLPTDAAWLMGAPNSTSISALGSGGWSGEFPTSPTGYQQVKLNLQALNTPGLTGSWSSTNHVQFRFRFASGATPLNLSGWTIDDFRLGGDLVEDVGPVELVSPTTKAGNTGAEEVTVRLRNFGGLLVTSIPVSVSITGPSTQSPQVLTGTWIGSLTPNAEATYTFLSTADFSRPGSYAITVTTNLASDTLASNNDLVVHVLSVSRVSSLPYHEGFDEGLPENARLITQPGLYPSASAPSANIVMVQTDETSNTYLTASDTIYGSKVGHGSVVLDCDSLVTSNIPSTAAVDFHFDLSGLHPATDPIWMQWSRRSLQPFYQGSGTGIFASIDGGVTWALCCYLLPALPTSPSIYWVDEKVNISSVFLANNVPFSSKVVLRIQVQNSSTQSIIDEVRVERFSSGLNMRSLRSETGNIGVVPRRGGVVLGIETFNTSTSSVTVNALTVAFLGSMPASAIASSTLVEDLDDTQTVTPSDALRGTFVLQGSTATVTPIGLTLGGNASRRLLVSIVLDPTLSEGHTLQAAVLSGTTQTTPVGSAKGEFPIVGYLYTVSPLLDAPYATSFESMDWVSEGWGLEGKRDTVWEHGTVIPYATALGNGPTAAKTGTKVFATRIGASPRLEGDYRDLVTPEFSLKGMVDPVVSFWMHINGEALAFQFQKNGGAYLTPSRNDPAWISTPPITSVHWESPAHDGWNSNFAQSGTWVKVSLRLSTVNSNGVTGTTSQDTVRFKYSWRVKDANNRYPGVSIDDFEISEFVAPSPAPSWSPTVSVNFGGAAVADGGTVTVASGTSVASRNISIAVNGTTPTSLKAFVYGAGSGNGILSSEWGRSSLASSYTITPTSGTFNNGGSSYYVLLRISNGTDFVERRFTINVNPPTVASVSLPNLSGEPLNLLNFPLGVVWLGGEPVSSLAAIVRYHPGQIRFLSANLHSSQSSQFSVGVNDSGGTLRITIAANGTTANLTSGVAATLSFQVLATATPGTSSIEFLDLRTHHANGAILHNLAASSAIAAAGQISISVVPPTLRVLWGQFPVSNGGIISVPYRSTMAAAGITLRGEGRASDSLTLSTTMPAGAAAASLLATEFSATGTQSVQSIPFSGQFLIPGATYTFAVSVATPSSSDNKTFTILVGPNTAPQIAVRIGGATISNGSNAIVPIGTTLASLGMVIVASDADGDQVSLDGTISNVTTQGFMASQLAATGSPAQVNAFSGAFSVPGASHTFSLEADDGIGGTAAMTFTLTARSNAAPTIRVTVGGIQVSNNQPIPVAFYSTMADLDLAIRVSDVNDDTVNLSMTSSGTLPVGFNPGQFSATSAVSNTTLRPISGRFRSGGTTATFSLVAQDMFGASSTFTLIFATGQNAPPVLTATMNGEAIASSQVVSVQYGSLLGSLGIRIGVEDLLGTSATLTTTISNLSGQGAFNLGEWNRTAPVPFTRTPLSGRFEDADTNHVVILSADDGDGGVSSLTFTIAVGANIEPLLTVTSNGEPALAAYGVSPGSNLSALGLAATAINQDPYESFTLSVELSDSPIQGYPSEAISVSSLTSLASLNVPNGVFTQTNVFHTLTFRVIDAGGLTGSATISIFVSSSVKLSTRMLPMAKIGQEYSTTVSAVLGTTPYTFTSNGLPTWLSLNPTTGALTGTPPRAIDLEPATIVFTVTDSDPLEPTANSATLSLEYLPASPVDVKTIPSDSISTLVGASTAIEATLDVIRNTVTSVDLPFPVMYFGREFSRVFVSTNGWVSFTDPQGNSFPTNTRLTSAAGPRDAIFLFWDQLELRPGGNAKIEFGTASGAMSINGPLPNVAHDRAIIRFQNLSVVGHPSSSLTGQIVIDAATSSILLEYPAAGQSWTGVTATIGLRGPFESQSVDPFGLGAQAQTKPVKNVMFETPDVVVMIAEMLPPATQYSSYAATIHAHGGLAPYTWAIVSGPDWIAINAATGVLTGMPLAPHQGEHQLVITVAAANGSLDTRSLSLTVIQGIAPPAPILPDSGSQCSLAAGNRTSVSICLGLSILALMCMAAPRRLRMYAYAAAKTP